MDYIEHSRFFTYVTVFEITLISENLTLIMK